MAEFALKNGLVFGSAPELKAHIRTLEVFRDRVTLDDADKKLFADWLDDAHAVKAEALKPKPTPEPTPEPTAAPTDAEAG